MIRQDRWRLARWVGSVLVTAALTLGAAAARAGPHAAPPPPPSGASPSPLNTRWAGYVVMADKVSFSGVAGTWAEPKVTCGRGGSPALSTVWVGLGGYTTASKVLDQVGTNANCDAKGRASYFAWFELLPDVAHPVDLPVDPGDAMSGSVTVVKLNLVEVKLEDLTRRWNFERQIKVGVPDGSSAEWVVEAPYSCLRFKCDQAPLANFGSVSIRHISAIGNGRSGTLATPAWKPTLLRLAPCGPTGGGLTGAYRATAIPQPVSQHGRAFDISWARAKGGKASCRPGTVGQLPDVTLG